MTDLTHRPQAASGHIEGSSPRHRLMTAALVILAAVVVALGAWLIIDRNVRSDVAISGEVEALVDEYMAAWNDYDAEAFLAIVTTDYTLHMTSGDISISQQAEEAAAMFESLEASEWSESRVGEPMMTGDGPWFVSLVEHFDSPDYGPEGADGVSTLTIVDHEGGLKVARHTYVGNN